MGVPKHGARVVVGGGAQGGAQLRCVFVVLGAAGAAAIVGDVVDGAEGGGGEGREDAGVGAHGFGDGLAAGKSGFDQVVGVGCVDAGAGRAARLAAVSACSQKAAGRLIGGAVRPCPMW